MPLEIAGNALMIVNTRLKSGELAKISGVSLELAGRTLNIGATHHNYCPRERLVRTSVHDEIDKIGDFK